MLKFQVQGSAKLPYTVTAEGEGTTFRVFCSCPAGRKGGNFCKHAAAILMGDVTNLVGQSDDFSELARMSRGSSLIQQALSHRPANETDEWVHIQTLEDVALVFKEKFEALGLECEISRDLGNIPERLPCNKLCLYACFKNGKRKKTPLHVLSFTPLTTEWKENEEVAVPTHYNVRERQRPWAYAGKTKSTLAKIIPDFLKGVGIL